MFAACVFGALSSLLGKLKTRRRGWRRRRGSSRKIRTLRRRRSIYQSRLQRQSQATTNISNDARAAVPQTRNPRPAGSVPMASSSVQQQESTELQNGSTCLDAGSPEHIGVETLEPPTPSNSEDQDSRSLLTNVGSFERDPDAVSAASSTGFAVVDIQLPVSGGACIDNQVTGNDIAEDIAASCETSSRSLSTNVDSFERDPDAVIASSIGFSAVDMELLASGDHQASDKDADSCESSASHCNRLTTDCCGENNCESSISCGKEECTEVPSNCDSGYSEASKSSMDTVSQVKESDKLYAHVEEEGIMMEELHTTSDGMAVVGTLLVLNETYEKDVGARYTVNRWESYSNSAAQWAETVEEGRFDRFKVCVELPLDQREDYQVMEVAFYFGHHWDNNRGLNYTIPL